MKIFKFVLRSIYFFPIYFFDYILSLYSKFLILFDPTESECKLEEIYFKRILKKRGSGLRYKFKLDYSPRLKQKIVFFTPTKKASFRAHSYLYKEPETIKWIDKFGSKKKVFFDIGANVGTYSLYYAKLFQSKVANVFSFEPQSQNLILLNENIKLNILNKKIVVISNTLYLNNTITKFTTLDLFWPGISRGTIRKNNYSSFKLFKKGSKIETLGLSFTIDFLVENRILPTPNLIKVDVDGNEKEIIQGAMKTLKKTECQTILIEINSNLNFIKNTLSSLGFKEIPKVGGGIVH